MSVSSDPLFHQRCERQFIRHSQSLLSDDRLRLQTKNGPRLVKYLIRDVNSADQGIALKRLMSELGKPDRKLEAQMPVGPSIDVTLSQKKWLLFKTAVARMRVSCLSPARALLAGQTPQPMSAADVSKTLGEMAPPQSSVPAMAVVMSTSGFSPDAIQMIEEGINRQVILVCPASNGGWSVYSPPNLKEIALLFDPEADLEKKNRLRKQIEADQVELLTSGLAAEKLAARTGLTQQFVETELKSYARKAGLAVKRLDGHVVLFHSGMGSSAAPAQGVDMPFIDRLRTIFARKGDVDKKIAFLSERRTALSQQADRGYEEIAVLETKEADLRKQFKDAGADLARRRIAGQLLQLRKDMERRQQLLSVLGRQVNVVSTHLHNLELQKQGKAAQLPDAEEMASDAAAAEEVMADLEASTQAAEEAVGSFSTGMSEEEQALYDELLGSDKAPEGSAEKADETAAPKAAAPAQKTPPAAPRQRIDPEPG